MANPTMLYSKRLPDEYVTWMNEAGTEKVTEIEVIPEHTVSTTAISGKYRAQLTNAHNWTDNYYYESHVMASVADITIGDTTYYNVEPIYYAQPSIISITGTNRTYNGIISTNCYFGNVYLGCSIKTHDDNGLDWCLMTRSHSGQGAEAGAGVFVYTRTAQTDLKVKMVIHQKDCNYVTNAGPTGQSIYTRCNDDSGSCGYSGVMIGAGNVVGGRGAFAFGEQNKLSTGGSHGMVLGAANDVTGMWTTVVGADNYVVAATNSGAASGTPSINHSLGQKTIIGQNNMYLSRPDITTDKTDNTVIIGNSLICRQEGGTTNHGMSASSAGCKTVIGNGYEQNVTKAYGYFVYGDGALAIGCGSNGGVTAGGTAIGRNNYCWGKQTVCLGNSIRGYGRWSLGLGYGVATTRAYMLTIGADANHGFWESVQSDETTARSYYPVDFYKAKDPQAGPTSSNVWSFMHDGRTQTHNLPWWYEDITAVTFVEVNGYAKTLNTDYTLQWDSNNHLVSLSWVSGHLPKNKDAVCIGVTGYGVNSMGKYRVLGIRGFASKSDGNMTTDNQALFAISNSGELVLPVKYDNQVEQNINGTGVVVTDRVTGDLYKIGIANGQIEVTSYTI